MRENSRRTRVGGTQWLIFDKVTKAIKDQNLSAGQLLQSPHCILFRVQYIVEQWWWSIFFRVQYIFIPEQTQYILRLLTTAQIKRGDILESPVVNTCVDFWKWQVCQLWLTGEISLGWRPPQARGWDRSPLWQPKILPYPSFVALNPMPPGISPFLADVLVDW